MITVDEVSDLVCSVWSTMLGMELEGRDVSVTAGGQPTVTASIQIAGAWEGGVQTRCSATCARNMAASMFMMDAEEVSFDEVKDAMAELVNMVGGNLKGLLPEGCHLSLPSVAAGVEYSLAVKGAVPVHQMGFDCDGEPLVVEVYSREGAEGALA